MAEIVRLILPAEGEAKKTPVAQSAPGDGSGSSSSSGSGTGDGALSASDVVGAAKKVVAYTGIKQIANSVISYEISTVNLRTGAAEYQQRLQFAYNEGSKALSSVGAIAMGAVVGGPAGAAVAAAGVALSYIMKFIGWGQNAARLQTEQNLENISLGFASVRAGITGRRSNSQ